MSSTLTAIGRMTIDDGVAAAAVKQAGPLGTGLKWLAGPTGKAVAARVAGGAGAGYATGEWLMPEGVDEATKRQLRMKNVAVGTLMAMTGAKASPSRAMLLSGELAGGLVANSYMTESALRTASNQRLADAQVADTLAQTAVRETESARNKAQTTSARSIAVATGILSATALGAIGYDWWKTKRDERKRKGMIRVTLPTKRIDSESQVDIPLAALPNETYKGVLRDTRRHLRSEVEERKRRKGQTADEIRQGGALFNQLSQVQGAP